MKKLSYKILAALAMLPYVSLIEFPMDTTPYFIIVLSLVLVLQVIFSKNIIKIQKGELLVLIFMMYFCMLLFVRFFLFIDLDSFRALGNYISFFIAIAFFSMIGASTENTRASFVNAVAQLLLIVSSFYLVASFFQVSSRLTGISALSDVIQIFMGRKGRTSDLRGFTSLAVEPSYAGIVCSLIGCISIYLFRLGYICKNKSKITVVNCAITTILAASATTVPLIILFFYYAKVTYSIKIISVRFILYSICISCLALSAVNSGVNSDNLRFLQLSEIMFDNQRSIVEDESATRRVRSIVSYSLPLLSGQNYFGNVLSGDSESYMLHIIDNAGLNDSITEMLKPDSSGYGFKTMSSISNSIYMFGMFSLLFWMGFIYRVRSLLKKQKEPQVLLLMLIIGYLIQVPLAHPTFLLAIGLIIIINTKEFPNNQCGRHFYVQPSIRQLKLINVLK